MLVAATNRVYDLLESVQNLEKKNVTPAFVDEDDKPEYVDISRMDPWLLSWKSQVHFSFASFLIQYQGDYIRDFKNANSSPTMTRRNSINGEGRIIYGKLVKFDNVVLISHTGRVLADSKCIECNNAYDRP